MNTDEKKPTRRSRAVAAKRAAILEAALTFFSQFGIHGTSLDKVAEEPGSLRMIARHFQLQPDVATNSDQWILIVRQRAQRCQPDIQNLLKHRHIEHFFRGKIVEQISFRDIGQLGHLIEAGAVNAKL